MGLLEGPDKGPSNYEGHQKRKSQAHSGCRFEPSTFAEMLPPPPPPEEHSKGT